MAFLLVAADQEWPAGRALPAVEHADSLGGVQFVARKRQQVDVPELPLQVDGDLADGLGCIGVENDGRIGLFGQPGQLFDGKNDPGLIVGVHDADHERVRGDARTNSPTSRLPSASTLRKVTS